MSTLSYPYFIDNKLKKYNLILFNFSSIYIWQWLFFLYARIWQPKADDPREEEDFFSRGKDPLLLLVLEHLDWHWREEERLTMSCGRQATSIHNATLAGETKSLSGVFLGEHAAETSTQYMAMEVFWGHKWYLADIEAWAMGQHNFFI